MKLQSALDPDEARRVMHSIIQRIATGPTLSKAIEQEEARVGMRAILEGHVSAVQAAVFLIALRMKRETEEENRGILTGIQQLTTQLTVPVDEVVDIADPYNGYNRTLPAAPFLPQGGNRDTGWPDRRCAGDGRRPGIDRVQNPG